jgi:uncharacterized protein YndB with AHSA1/START domain
MESKKVERSTWLGASRERVWLALTEPEQIMAWLVPSLPNVPMTRSENGSLTIHMGPMQMDVMRLETLDAPKRLVIRTVPDGLITVHYTLEEKNNGTTLSVSVCGFEALPESTYLSSLSQTGVGWERALSNLEAYLVGTALPFPQAHVAPLFAYWHETQATFALERSIWIDVPIERVWQAVTDPVQIEGWFSPGTQWQYSAFEVGGKLFVADPESGAEKHTQIIEVIEAPYRFVTRTPTDGSGKSETTTYNLQAEGSGTRLTIQHSGYERIPEVERWASLEQNTFGFGMVLQNVKAYVEGQSLTVPGGF